MTRLKRLVVVGYFGFGNAGDEAILEAMLAALRKEIGESFAVSVVSGDPPATRLRAAGLAPGGLTAISWRDPLAVGEAVRDSDLVIVGGGGLFHDYWGADPGVFLTDLDFGVGFFAAPALLASLLGKPVMLYAVGAGPLKGRPARDLVAAAVESASSITVRDERSAAELAELGADLARIVVAADPVWGLELPPPAGRAAGAAPRLAVALRSWAFGVHPPFWEREVARALDRFLDCYGGSVTLVPFQIGEDEPEADLAVAERVRFLTTHPDDVTIARPAEERQPFTAAELAELFDRHDLVVAMRLHALILAARRELPFVAIAYDTKVSEAATALAADAVPIADLNADRLYAAIETARAEAPRAVTARRSAMATLAAGAQLSAREAASLLAAGARPGAPASRHQTATAEGILALQRRLGAVLADLAAATSRQTLLHGEAEAAESRARGERERAAAAEQRTEAAEQRAEASAAEVEQWKRVSISARAEVEDWKKAHDRAMADLDAARTSLAEWRASRAFRAAEAYWRLRRRAARLLRPWRPARGSQSATGAMVSGEAKAQGGAVAPPPTDRAGVVPRERAARTGSVRLPRLPCAGYDLVVFSIIDWDFRFQRPQQLATQWARHGHRVFYLSTTKFLPPGGEPFELVDQAPGIVELRLRSRPLDVYGGRLEDDDLERIAEAFDALGARFGIGDCVSMVEIPFWAPLAWRLRERRGWRVVYDCMDEWTNFPGFGRDVLALEDRLVRDADLTTVSSQRLLEKLSGQAGRLVLAKNGVDGAHYRALFGPNELLAGIAHPCIGYFGALASWVDVPLLVKVAQRFPHASLVLAGGHFDVDLSPLAKLPNVHLLGQRPYDEMPRLLWHFDVCLIPFLVNEITEATNPVKFYEYLTSGKPVVAPALTELLPYRDLCYLAEADSRGAVDAVDHERLLSELERALAERNDDPRREARRRVAAENDWSARYATIDAAVRTTHPLVSVVVVTFGGLSLTRRCLASLLEGETWPNLEVLVVDNASTDGTDDWLRELAARDRRVRAILNDSNRGFAAANNMGLQEGRGELLMLLNNDTVVPPGLLGRLVTHLERDRSIGLVCPTTNFCGNEAKVHADYRLDTAGLPETDEALGAAAAARAVRHRGQSFDIPMAAMYCVAFRRDVLDAVGLLDETYGAGMFEDDDFSRRVREAGFRVVCAEDAYVHHVGQASFSQIGREEYERLFAKNRAYFERKWKQTWMPHRTREGVEPPLPRV